MMPQTDDVLPFRNSLRGEYALLLARARAMRKALVAAAERAKVQLWETTLEQGVLVGLAKEGSKGKR